MNLYRYYNKTEDLYLYNKQYRYEDENETEYWYLNRELHQEDEWKSKLKN